VAGVIPESTVPSFTYTVFSSDNSVADRIAHSTVLKRHHLSTEHYDGTIVERKLESMEVHANLSRAVPPSQAGFGELIGQSAPMSRLYEVIAKVSQSISHVLVIRETGTGKELVARAIHFKGLQFTLPRSAPCPPGPGQYS
jgi:two-component system response regulator AtoC